MFKLLTVFGAVGNQDSSVLDSIFADSQLSKEFKLRSITRDTTKTSSHALVKQGVDVVSTSVPSIFRK